MPMKVEGKGFSIKCDVPGCQTHFTSDQLGVHEMRQQAYNEGWTTDYRNGEQQQLGELWFCPPHGSFPLPTPKRIREHHVTRTRPN